MLENKHPLEIISALCTGLSVVFMGKHLAGIAQPSADVKDKQM